MTEEELKQNYCSRCANSDCSLDCIAKDEAIVYVETDEGIYHITGITDIVTGDDVQNEITLLCL